MLKYFKIFSLPITLLVISLVIVYFVNQIPEKDPAFRDILSILLGLGLGIMLGVAKKLHDKG